ncbi:permease, partial [Mycolicibacterium goodii]|uniref:permease n=1 Tax=Mycolicibacterium goodii TaxID=134601 RepID=UPI001BDCC146
LGVVISGLIAVVVTPDRLARRLPRRTSAAIVVAGVGGAALPGGECGSVPGARRLFGDGAGAGTDKGTDKGTGKGHGGAAALTFML